MDRHAADRFIQEHAGRCFLGSRRPLLDEMLAFAGSDSSPNIFALVGAPGSGKTALLAKFHQMVSVGSSARVLAHFVGASPGSTDLRRVLSRLCDALAPREPIPTELDKLADHLGGLLSSSTVRIVIVLDALDLVDANDRAHTLHWLPRKLPAHIRIVLSGLEQSGLDALLRRGRQVRIETLAPLQLSDARTILETFLRRAEKHLSSDQLTALLTKTDAILPLYLLAAVENLGPVVTDEEISARIAGLSDNTCGLFRQIVRERLSSDPGLRDSSGGQAGAALVKKLASCLGVSRQGLSPAEIVGLLDPDDPLGNVAALLRRLRPYLMWRGERLDFHPGPLKEAVAAEYLNHREQRGEAHQALADYFLGVADPSKDGEFKGSCPHALSELPHHQAHAAAWSALVSTLTSLFFLEAKCHAGLAFELARDFAEAAAQLPVDHPQKKLLGLLEKALRRNLAFIAARFPGYRPALFQCLWNTCCWVGRPPQDSPLVQLMERWRTERENRYQGFCWLRSLRPPLQPLDSAQTALISAPDGARRVAYSPDGRQIAAVTWERVVRIWDPATGQELASFDCQPSLIYCLTYTPDGSRLIVGGEYGQLFAWDIEARQEIGQSRERRLHDGLIPIVTSVACLPDGRVLSLDRKSEMCLYDLENESRLGGFILSIQEPRLSFFAPRRWMRYLSALNRGISQKLRRVPKPNRSVDSGRAMAVLSPDGRRLAVYRNCVLQVMNLELPDRVTVLWQDNLKAPVSGVAFTPDSDRLLIGSEDGSVTLREVGTGHELKVLRGQPGWIFSLACSPDGRRAITGGASTDGTLRLWRLDTGEMTAVLGSHEDEINSVAFSPDGGHIASGSSDGTVRIWPADTTGIQLSPDGHEDTMTAIAYSADGAKLASGAMDSTIRVWSAEKGCELLTLRGHRGLISAIAFSPDGSGLVSSSRDGIVRGWDAESGRSRGMLQRSRDGIFGLAYSPGGRWVVSASVNGEVWLLDAHVFSRQPQRLLGKSGARTYRGTRRKTEMVFSPDGKRLFVACEGEVGQIFEFAESLDALSAERAIQTTVITDPQRSLSQLEEFYQPPVTNRPNRPMRYDTMLDPLDDRFEAMILPGRLQRLTPSPDGRTWAGGANRQVQVYRLERKS